MFRLRVREEPGNDAVKNIFALAGNKFPSVLLIFAETSRYFAGKETILRQ